MRKEFAPVSVIIPAYNAADTLDRALKSVFAQTLLPAEIIVVNDASTDGTLVTLECLLATKPVGIITKIISLSTNGGASNARNEGWLHASQIYLAFLDADDSWHPQKLEIQYEWMRTHPSIKICGHKCQVEESSTTIRRTSIDANSIPIRTMTQYRFVLGNPVSTPTVMLARDITHRFDPNKRYAEDYLLWAQIVQSHETLVFFDVVLTYLHKPKYGSSGLSAQLFEMERGEIDTLWQFYRSSKKRFHDFVLFIFSFILSILKFLYRVLINFLK
jgi:glycosyltransferase involved in cell wall biosynthesis